MERYLTPYDDAYPVRIVLEANGARGGIDITATSGEDNEEVQYWAADYHAALKIVRMLATEAV